MEFVFDLDDDHLQIFMRSTVLYLRWTYVALWSLDQNTQQLVCREGWYNREMEAGSSSMPAGLALGFFNAYKMCRFDLNTGFPSLALNSPTVVWLNVNEALQLSSSNDQSEFYRVAGIQTVVFIRCGLVGVIELGTINMVPGNEMAKSSILATIYAQLAPQATSPSSSLLSRSIDSPDSSSMGTIPTTSTSDRRTTEEQLNIPPPLPLPLPPRLPFFYPSVTPYTVRGSEVYTPGAPSQPRIPGQQPLPFRPFPQQTSSSVTSIRSAFQRWRTSGRIPLRPQVGGSSHSTFRRSVQYFRQIQNDRMRSLVASMTRPGPPPSTSQVHHMISERRRREKLKESFDALRSLLPPGSRKDKASILANTKEYLVNLKTHIEELQRTNEQLESLVREKQQGGNEEEEKEEEEGGGNTEEATASMGTHVTVEEEGASDVLNSNVLGLRVVVENPSNTIDSMMALLNSLRRMQLHMISFVSRTTEATPPQFVVNLRIRLPQEWTEDAGRREQVKEGIVIGMGGAPR